MKKAMFCLALTFLVVLTGGGPISADITVEMKSSFTGFPFFSTFEMYQTMAMQEGRILVGQDMEIGVMDTTIATQTKVMFDYENMIMEVCSWEDSTCYTLEFSEIEDFLKSDSLENMIDSLLGIVDSMGYLDSIKQYVNITKMDFSETDNRQTISGYDCMEMRFVMEGDLNLPIPEMPGSFNFKINGSSWGTKDFSGYDEYMKVVNAMKERFFTEQVMELIQRVGEIFNLPESFMDGYLSYYDFVWVQSNMDLSLAVISPDMDEPSMSFNMKLNQVLLDISQDKIPDEMFKSPAGFKKETKDFKSLKESL